MDSSSTREVRPLVPTSQFLIDHLLLLFVAVLVLAFEDEFGGGEDFENLIENFCEEENICCCIKFSNRCSLMNDNCSEKREKNTCLNWIRDHSGMEKNLSSSSSCSGKSFFVFYLFHDFIVKTHTDWF